MSIKQGPHLAHRRELAEFLIEQGADVNLQDIYGQTALHYAIKEYTENVALTIGWLEPIKGSYDTLQNEMFA